jgi:predicted enzyme related to lactoylglutathione lyase
MPKVGAIAWVDLTVKQAGRVKTFYERVVGWTARSSWRS